MRRFSKLISGVAAIAAAVVLAPSAGAAGTGFSLFGDATKVAMGHNSEMAVQLVSDSDPGFGSIEFKIPDDLTFADLTELGTDFNVTDDNCGDGSPRFSIYVDQAGTEKQVFSYLGTAPDFNTCTANTWEVSGDLLETGKTVDTTQLGGTADDTYDNAVTNYGSLMVTKLSLVVDDGATQVDGEQTVLVDNVMVNAAVYDFESAATGDMPSSKDECKKGGWQNYNGQFKNQGDCVSFVASNGQNQPSGSSTTE